MATFGTGIFVTYLVPTSLLFLPLAQVINWLGLADSKWALVLTYPTFLVPFCTWLLMGYFRTVPKEVEECAMVDGATRIQALWRIVLPIAIPGLVCAALFAFTLSWNEFIYALTFTSSSEQITASVGVTTELIRGDIYFWGSLMAGAVLGSVPIVILYVFFLDYYVSGLTRAPSSSPAAAEAAGSYVQRSSSVPSASLKRLVKLAAQMVSVSWVRASVPRAARSDATRPASTCTLRVISSA